MTTRNPPSLSASPSGAAGDLASSFAMQRQRLLAHAGLLLDGDGKAGDGKARDGKANEEKVSRLAQALVTALELLKVAEQEVVDEQRRHATIEESHGRQLAHFHALFDLAPVPLLLTTTDTSIREANAAAARLIGADVAKLEGRQLLSMVPRAQAAEFKQQLGYMLELGRVAAWPFTLEVDRDAPITVTASVDTVDDPSVGARALYWTIRPLAF